MPCLKTSSAAMYAPPSTPAVNAAVPTVLLTMLLRSAVAPPFKPTLPSALANMPKPK